MSKLRERGWSRRRSAWDCCPGTTGKTGFGATPFSTKRSSSLQRWREATALPAGPAADDVIGRLRGYLADDLDTPKALAAVDGWATDALTYGGHDPSTPALSVRLLTLSQE